MTAFLTERGLPWRDDATNADTSFARNHIRHEILPRLPDAVGVILARTAECARDEEDYWSAEIARMAPEHLQRKRKAILLEVEKLIALPIAVQRRLVRHVIQEVKGNLRAIDLHHIESILRLAHAVDGHGRTQIPGIDCFRSYEWLSARSATYRNALRTGLLFTAGNSRYRADSTAGFCDSNRSC